MIPNFALTGTFGVFGDQVYSSTDLNRRHAEVLNHARTKPVTISRNNEQFALMNREQAASLVKAVASMGETIQLLRGALSLVTGTAVPTSISWLTVFNKPDLNQFMNELATTAEKAFADSQDWDSVETLVHEWRETACAMQSGVLNEALLSEREEVPLTDPKELIEQEPALFAGE